MKWWSSYDDHILAESDRLSENEKVQIRQGPKISHWWKGTMAGPGSDKNFGLWWPLCGNITTSIDLLFNRSVNNRPERENSNYFNRIVYSNLHIYMAPGEGDRDTSFLCESTSWFECKCRCLFFYLRSRRTGQIYTTMLLFSIWSGSPQPEFIVSTGKRN